jgi:plasmid stabilization system protein ParE
MTRLERIIKAFNEYDEIVDDLAYNNNDGSREHVVKELRKEVKSLIAELKRYGCRRDEEYLKWGFYGSPKENK